MELVRLVRLTIFLGCITAARERRDHSPRYPSNRVIVRFFVRNQYYFIRLCPNYDRLPTAVTDTYYLRDAR